MVRRYQTNNCKQWMLDGIPQYNAGVLSSLFYNCGAGLADDNSNVSEEDSFMHIITQTDESEYLRYCERLRKNNFVLCYKNDAGKGNMFRQYMREDVLLYTYYNAVYREVRIILDKCGVSVKDFEYNADGQNCVSGAILQYGLYYGDMIRHYTSDCGMLYAVRLSDNSLVITDGGESEQSTDAAITDFMSLLREMTGNDGNEKIRISAWFCTHPHDDHIDFFSKFICVFRNDIILERVMFNFPSGINLRYENCVPVIKTRIKTFFPGVKLLKLHTGMEFTLGNALFTVLATHEDIAENNDKPICGFNASSTIMRIVIEDRVFLITGDMQEVNEEYLLENYELPYLHADYMQAPHHLINSCYATYLAVRPDNLLVPQCRSNFVHKLPVNYAFVKSLIGEDNIYPAHDGSYLFEFNKDVTEKKFRAQAGSPYDGSLF